jgi:PAS domain S-box-containing protein
VTARLRAEAATRQSEELYRVIFNQLAVGISHAALDGKILRLNPKALDILGYSEEDIPGLTIEKVSHPEDWAATREGLLALETGGARSFVQEKRFLRRDGSEVWGRVMVSLVPAVDDTPGYTITVVEDISEQRTMVAALTRAKELAEEANKTKSEFLANMSHEIRTPLNGVLGMLQLLKGTALDLEQNDYTDKATDASRRLLSLLSDLLDFSRIEAGKLTLHPAPFRLAEVFDTVRNVLGGAAMKKGLSLRMEMEPSLPATLLGDETRIRQVLFNLVGNAVKFTNEGSVRVRAWAQQELPHEPLWVHIDVIDTGMGIPDQMHDAIFERFTQTDSTYSRQHEGAGLGLTIVRHILELMGGSISVQSHVGQGTTMSLALPLAALGEQAPATASKPASVSLAPTLTPLRVLLAEDEEISQFAMQVMLRRMGHTVTAVGTGRAAVEALAEAEFDVVLMDIQMPEMDGVAATRIIRAMSDKAKAGVPIVALTAYAMEGDREKFLSTGMDDYVTKPVNQEDLLRALEHVRLGRAERKRSG